jgi:hypothetical protein
MSVKLRYVLIAGSIVIGLLLAPTVVGALAPPEVKSGPATPVAIVDPLPVPVSGDVAVSGAVDANVTAVPSDVLDRLDAIATSGLRAPVLLSAQIADDTAGENLKTSGTQVEFVVPSGKQLVIEYVSVETFDQALDGNERYQVFFTVPSNSLNRFLVGTVTADNSFFEFGPETGELVSIRVPEGETVRAVVFSNFDVLVNVDVSGYLEDV